MRPSKVPATQNKTNPNCNETIKCESDSVWLYPVRMQRLTENIICQLVVVGVTMLTCVATYIIVIMFYRYGHG